MTIAELKPIIKECCNDVLFIYRGKECGITSEVSDSVPTFQSWYGDKIAYYPDVDSLVIDRLFDGKTLSDIINQIDITFA